MAEVEPYVRAYWAKGSPMARAYYRTVEEAIRGVTAAFLGQEENPKAPWRMTRDEYLAHDRLLGYWGREIEELADQVRSHDHRVHVERALKAGKPVPPEVLADYPELREGNPGVVKRFLGGALGKAGWVLPFDEFVSKVRAEMVKRHQHGSGPLEPMVVEGLRVMYDEVAEAYRVGGPEAVDEALRGVSRVSNPAVQEWLWAVKGGKVMFSSPMEGARSPDYKNHAEWLDMPDVADRQKLCYGRVSVYKSQYDGSLELYVGSYASDAPKCELGRVKAKFKSSHPRYSDVPWSDDSAANPGCGNPIDLATIVGVGVLAGAVQGVVEPYVTKHVYGMGTMPVGVGANPYRHRGYRKPPTPGTHLYEAWKVEPGAKDRVVSYEWHTPEGARERARELANDQAYPFYLVRMDTHERVEPGTWQVGNPATTYLGWPVVIIGSHRSWDKVKGLVGEDNLIELYTYDRQRSAGTGYAAIRPSKLSMVLGVRAVSRATFRGKVDLHPAAEHTGWDPWPLARVVAEEYRASGGVPPWAEYDAGRPVGNPYSGTDVEELRDDLGVSEAALQSYDPVAAVHKVGRYWNYITLQGNEHPTLFDTRREALAVAARHLKLKRDQYEDPSGYSDIVRVRARKRLALMDKYQRQGMTEMESGKRAYSEIPEAMGNPSGSGMYLIQVFGKGYLAGSEMTEAGIKDRYTHDPREALRVSREQADELQRQFAGAFAAVPVEEALRIGPTRAGNPYLKKTQEDAYGYGRHLVTEGELRGWKPAGPVLVMKVRGKVVVRPDTVGKRFTQWLYDGGYFEYNRLHHPGMDYTPHELEVLAGSFVTGVQAGLDRPWAKEGNPYDKEGHYYLTPERIAESEREFGEQFFTAHGMFGTTIQSARSRVKKWSAEIAAGDNTHANTLSYYLHAIEHYECLKGEGRRYVGASGRGRKGNPYGEPIFRKGRRMWTGQMGGMYGSKPEAVEAARQFATEIMAWDGQPRDEVMIWTTGGSKKEMFKVEMAKDTTENPGAGMSAAQEALKQKRLGGLVRTTKYGVISWADYVKRQLEAGGSVELVEYRDYNLRKKLEAEYERMNRGFNVPWGNASHPKTIAAQALKDRLAGEITSPQYHLTDPDDPGAYTVINKTLYDYGMELQGRESHAA